MRVLVIGGTGKVGSALVEALVGRGVDVRVLSRSAGATDGRGVERVAGDLTRPETLPAAFAGVDRCYLLTPLAPDEVEQGLNAVEAAREAGLERLVFQSVLRAADAPEIPHFASKVRILDRIRESGLPWVVLSPGSFYQNDLAMRDLILGPGLYPNPVGLAGINRVDVRDIADVAAAALLDEGFESREVPVVGPDTWTGPSIAAVYSDLLGRPVRYTGDDLEAWGTAASGHLPEWLVHDLTRMFEYFQEHTLLPTDRQKEESRAALGHEPRPFLDFAKELVAGA
jgi:uncharacterized protein YbjT (DUF2867 family)